jgi:small-conductance mechanosensitive channel
VSDASPQPPRGLVGIGIGGLTLEAIVLLLAAPAVATAQRGHVSAAGIGYLLGLAVLLVVAAAVLRKPRGRVVGTIAQPLVIAAGAVTWPMYVVGALFAGIWVYYLRLWPRSDSG